MNRTSLKTDASSELSAEEIAEFGNKSMLKGKTIVIYSIINDIMA